MSGRRRPGVLYVTEQSDRPEAETFIGIFKRGFRVRVMCSTQGKNLPLLEGAGVPVTPLEFARKVDKAAAKQIRAMLETGEFDILHLFNNRAVFNGLAAARGMNVRIVAYRGIVGNVSLWSPISRMRYLNPRVDRVVCVAEAVRRHFLDLRFFGRRLPPEKFVTIHKGHELSWYEDPAASLEELGPARPGFLVCCVANWRPRKGIELLVEAFERLPPEADIGLVLAGRMDSEALRRQIAGSPARARIFALGTREDAPAVAAACDAAVLPSLRREGLPKTVIEAMAYGVPPIVTNVGGSPELVVDRECGLVVPPGNAAALTNAILELYSDRALRQRLGAAARERIGTHFRLEDTIEKTAVLYEELCSVPASTHRAAPRNGDTPHP